VMRYCNELGEHRSPEDGVEKVIGNSDQRRGCGVLVLTCPISLAFDQSCLLLLVAWRPPTMKLISRLAD
jgi:hypothetical protein